MSDVATASALKETMATNVLQLLLRLCELHSEKDGGRAPHLARARLALALVHSESTMVCTLLNKDSQRITSLNQRLHSIIEQNLKWVFSSSLLLLQRFSSSNHKHNTDWRRKVRS